MLFRSLPVSIPGVAERGTGIQVKSKKWLNSNSTWVPGKILKKVLATEVNAKIEPVKSMLAEAVADTAFPGGVLLAAKNGQVFLHEAFGYHTYNKTESVTRGDIYDLASITKVIATTSAIMQLIDQKKISLDDKVVDHLPKFIGKQSNHFNQKSQTTIRHLMTHTAGLPDFKQYFLMDADVQTRLDSVMNTEPQFELEEKMVYSDVGLITLRSEEHTSELQSQ